MTEFIEDLGNLLYIFDEYVSPDKFEIEKFTELESLSRKAAPRIHHIIRRMKFPSSNADQESDSVPPLMIAQPAVMMRQPSAESASQHRISLPPLEEKEPDVKFAPIMHHACPKPDLGPRRVEPPAFAQIPSGCQGEPPQSTLCLDAWSRNMQIQGEEHGRRRDTIASSTSTHGSSNDSDYNYSHNISSHARPLQPGRIGAPRSPGRVDTNVAMGHQSEYRGRESMFSIAPMLRDRDSFSSSAGASAHSSGSGPRRVSESTYDMVSPVSARRRASGLSLEPQTPMQSQGQSFHVQPLFTRCNAPASVQLPDDGLEPVMMAEPSASSVPDGLIPVHEDNLAPGPPPFSDLETLLGGCAMNSDSSYFHFKGFCSRAVEAAEKGIEFGFRHVRKQVSFQDFRKSIMR